MDCTGPSFLLQSFFRQFRNSAQPFCLTSGNLHPAPSFTGETSSAKYQPFQRKMVEFPQGSECRSRQQGHSPRVFSPGECLTQRGIDNVPASKRYNENLRILSGPCTGLILDLLYGREVARGRVLGRAGSEISRRTKTAGTIVHLLIREEHLTLRINRLHDAPVRPSRWRQHAPAYGGHDAIQYAQ